MSEISEYIAISIAEGRLKKAKDALRPKLLQEAQLSDDGRLIDDADGVVSDFVDCPACDDTKNASPGYIEVPAPFGLEAATMAQPSVIDLAKLKPDDVILWGIQHGVLKLSVDNKLFEAFSNDATPESAYMMGVIGQSLRARTTDVLRVISSDKLRGEK